MGKIRRPISKPITSVQVNDITIFMKLKCRSAMSFQAIFKTFSWTKFVAEGRNCKYIWLRVLRTSPFPFRNWGPTLVLNAPYISYPTLLKRKPLNVLENLDVDNVRQMPWVTARLMKWAKDWKMKIVEKNSHWIHENVVWA